MFAMVIDTGRKFYVVPSASHYMTLRLRSQTYNFYVKSFVLKVFAVLLFAKPLIDHFIHVWHGDRNLSKSLCGPIPPQDMTFRSRSQT